MAAVIRVKRRLEDEPLNAVILNCKRRKTDTTSKDEEPELSTILKLAGTIKNQDEIYVHLKKSTKTELEDEFKKHNTDLSTKLRTQKQEESKKSRYKIVNCFRSKLPNTDEQLKSEYTIYDLETYNIHENQPSTSAADNSDREAKYVYDLYYTTSDDLGDVGFEDYVSMYPCSELTYGSMRDNGINEPDSDDSEDSNAESNWKNDYPDESDMESVTEDDMLEAMKKCDLNDLSSDDGEEGFIYSVDSESAGFEEDVDESDVQRYGERYARFKARHKKGIETSVINSDLYYGDIDEEEYYY